MTTRPTATPEPPGTRYERQPIETAPTVMPSGK
jgi:hypothetical protein